MTGKHEAPEQVLSPNLSPAGNTILLRKHFRDLDTFQDLAVAADMVDDTSAVDLVSLLLNLGNQLMTEVVENTAKSEIKVKELLGEILNETALLANRYNATLESIAKSHLEYLAVIDYRRKVEPND